MEYVYVYMHPEHPYLYVGRTCNLEKRIETHDTNDADNIDREYVGLLHEASVYYIPLQNKAESIIVETYLINKYKPLLNKMLKYEDVSSLEVKVPRFVKMDDALRKLHIQLSNAEQEISQKKDRLVELEEIKEKLMSNEERLEKLRKQYEEQTIEINMFNHISEEEAQKSYYFDKKEIEYFVERSNIDVTFYCGRMDLNTKKRMYFKMEKIGNKLKGYIKSSDDKDWAPLKEVTIDTSKFGWSNDLWFYWMLCGECKMVADKPNMHILYKRMLDKDMEEAKKKRDAARPYTAEELIQLNGRIPVGNYKVYDKRHYSIYENEAGDVRVHVRDGNICGVYREKLDDRRIVNDEELGVAWLEEHKEMLFEDDGLRREADNKISDLTQMIEKYMEGVR